MDLPRVTEADPDMIGKSSYLILGTRDLPEVIRFSSLTQAEAIVAQYEVYGPLPEPREEPVSVTVLREEVHDFYRSTVKSTLAEVDRRAVRDRLKSILDRWPENKGLISDGYHTFNELYAHRFALFAALAKKCEPDAWMSRLHHDGTMFEGGYFIAGIEHPAGQISYHWKIDRCWNTLVEAGLTILDHAPLYDGHTADDVTERLLLLATEG